MSPFRRDPAAKRDPLMQLGRMFFLMGAAEAVLLFLFPR